VPKNKTLAELKRNPKGVRLTDLLAILQAEGFTSLQQAIKFLEGGE